MKKNCLIKIILFVIILLHDNVTSFGQTENPASAFNFNGNNAYVIVSKSPLEQISGSFTIEFWMNAAFVPESGMSPFPIIGNDTTISIELNSCSNTFPLKGVSIIINFKDKTQLTQCTQKCTFGQSWNHFAIVFDGNNINVYTNGLLDNRYPTNNQTPKVLNPTGYNLLIGNSKWQGTNLFYRGLIKDVRIWGMALTQQTIQNWMGKIVDNSHPNWNKMIAYYKFDQLNIQNGSSVPDSKGSYTGKSVNVISSYVMPHTSFVPSSFAFYKQNPKFFPGGCIQTRKTCASYFNNNIYQFFYDLQNQSVQSAIVNLNDDNSTKLNSIKLINNSVNNSPGTSCFFNKFLYLFCNSLQDNKISYTVSDIKGNFSNNWKLINNQSFYTKLQPTSSVLDTNMFFFYINTSGNLMSTHSSDGEKWSAPVAIKQGLNTSSGNVFACTAKDQKGNEAIYLAYLSKTLDSINLIRVYREDSVVFENSISAQNVRNVSIVQGTVKGGYGGYLLQIFYSANINDIYGCGHSLGRIEYNINGNFSREEELPVCISDGQNSSTSDFDRIMPFAFSTYSLGMDSSLRKKILISMISSNCTYNKPNKIWITSESDAKYLCWMSDKFKYLPEEDTTDNNPDQRISTLLGIIEGPPPYVLNNEDLHTLIVTGENPSELEFGSSTSQSNDSSVTFGSDWSLKFRICGIGAQFQGYTDNTTKTGYSWKKTENRLFHPVEGKPLGYMVMLRPIISRKTYLFTDGNDNFNSYAYQYFISDRMLDVVPYELDTARKAPNPANFISYKNRDITFNDYEKIYQTDYSWAGGSPSEYAFEREWDSATILNTFISGGSGISVEISQGVGVGVDFIAEAEVTADAVIFQFDFEYNWSTEHEEAISMSNTKNISINLNCPYNGVKGDTNYFDGTMYWLKYTDGKDNWWVPKGYELQKPWCITYEIIKYTTLTGIIAGADENGIIKKLFLDNIYPNPSRSKLNFKFDVNEDMNVSMIVFDNLGNEVKTLFDGFRNRNHYNISWDGTDNNGKSLPAGVYYCRLSGKNNSVTKKISLIE